MYEFNVQTYIYVCMRAYVRDTLEHVPIWKDLKIRKKWICIGRTALHA